MSSLNNKPLEVSPSEWQEIVELPRVRELWGLRDETAEEFAARVYGVKFNFISGGPGYAGEMFILQGDALTGESPLVLGRRDEKLQTI